MEKTNDKKAALRAASLVVLGLIALLLISTVLFVYKRIEHRQLYMGEEGRLSLKEATVYEEPVYLSGEWEMFDGVVCKTSEEVSLLNDSLQWAKLPIASIVDAKKSATYRMYVELPAQEKEGLFLFIPTIFKSVNVYLNGVKLEHMGEGTTWLSHSSVESMMPMSSIDPHKKWQELVVSGDFKTQDATLYKRSIVMGTQRNVVALGEFSSSNEMFLFGLLILILINGYVFMLFRPSHKIISYMTLFDSMILMRSLLSMNYVLAFAKDIFPGLSISDQWVSSASLFFLMMGGFIGCKLSSALFDPKDEVSNKMVAQLPWIYVLFACTFPFFPAFFEMFGKYMLVVVYIITFIVVFMKYRVSRKIVERRVYNLLQFLKTMYIGALIFMDILFWDSGSDQLLLFYLYGAFFILHVVVRLYDNNESYQHVEVLNEGLEDTVAQRTKELEKANRILSELSVRDPLTNIFNRLHFEQAMETLLNSDVSEAYLCMFDLDFFKRVNDTFGHAAGDEQLISMVALVQQQLDGRATFARFGGEEFVLLLQDMSKEDALSCIQEVHASIARDAHTHETHTTASFGIAALESGDTSKSFLERADEALYEAKRRGRNQVVSQFEGTMTSIITPTK